MLRFSPTTDRFSLFLGVNQRRVRKVSGGRVSDEEYFEVEFVGEICFQCWKSDFSNSPGGGEGPG